MSNDIDLTIARQLKATLEADQPIHVLNLLRFRSVAQCGDGTASVGSTGREAYFNGYVPAFGAVAQERGVAGVKPIWIGDVAAAFVAAPGERWDLVAIIEYPSVDAFLRIVDSDAYRAKAEPLRRAAVEEWRLIAQIKAELPA